jgi:hypothetical protein
MLQRLCRYVGYFHDFQSEKFFQRKIRHMIRSVSAASDAPEVPFRHHALVEILEEIWKYQIKFVY